MRVDKKNSSGKIMSVMVKAIGCVAEKPYTYSLPPPLTARVLCAEASVSLGPKEKGQDTAVAVSCNGEVRVPGSKSISNRVLLLAGVSRGRCRIRGLLHSDDTQVMINALQQLGAVFEWEDGGATLVVTGNGGSLKALSPPASMYLSNAGTATRFLTTLCTMMGTGPGAVSAAASNAKECSVEVNGSERMLVRPIGPLVSALRAHGCKIDSLGKEGFLPLRIYGGSACALKGGHFHIEGKV